jgi:hypothetical protein
MDRIKQIHKRQLARFLSHLQRSGSLTPELEADVKRAYGFTFQDIEQALQGHDKEMEDGKRVENP